MSQEIVVRFVGNLYCDFFCSNPASLNRKARGKFQSYTHSLLIPLDLGDRTRTPAVDIGGNYSSQISNEQADVISAALPDLDAG